MIPKECKRLIEVDFPIAVVSKHAALEKRHGHPSTLHLWWARRPLAACRAVLMGLLLPDPFDDECPEEFKKSARKTLLKFRGRPSGWEKEITSDEGLRKVLLKFIGDFANWDFASDKDYLETARALVKAAHPEDIPLVVDPFAGGGSIPYEALRIGCDAFSSDLNPVACLIQKVMLEDIPRHGPKLADELRKVGQEIKKAAEKELQEFYPDDPDGAKPIAYLWARTVKCEAPDCGAEIPLMRSFWLCKKAKRKRALNFKVVRPKKGVPEVEFEILEPKKDSEVPAGTVNRAKAKCLACGQILAPDRVRAQLTDQRGGADVVFDGKGNRKGGARLLAVVTILLGEPGRHYRLPTANDYKSVWKAHKRLNMILNEWERSDKEGLFPVPDEPIEMNEIRRISVPLYGANTWGDVFTQRQQLSIYAYVQAIHATSTSDSCARLCSLALDRLLIVSTAHCRWKPTGESLIDIFGRHAIGMVWDYAESAPRHGSENIFGIWINKFAELVEFTSELGFLPGQIQQSDATQNYLPDESSQVWFTDPPYYDSIPYAHLSDLFYVWLKRSLPQATVGFTELLSPKIGECVVDRPHRLSDSNKDEEYFERKIAKAAYVGRQTLSSSGCASIVFAHKTTEGWEALLNGIINSRWCITASWPISTELATRLNARDTASLATSIHLVCRPRSDDAGIGDWGNVLRELPRRVRAWMERLQEEGIRGADLVFACIGPALEIYSRYENVEKADGTKVGLSEYLEKVWEVVGRIALEQVLGLPEGKATNSTAGALEEDSRLTALFLWTLQATNGQDNGDAESDSDDEDLDDEDAPKKKSKGYALIYDVVRRFAQPLGIHLEEWEHRVVNTEKGVVRLIPVRDRAKILFGEEGAQAVADRLESDKPASKQMALFPEGIGAVPEIKGRGKGRRKKAGASVSDDDLRTRREATTLDRVHAAMLLQAGGRSNALRALLKEETDRGPDFLRLANALSALYPKDSEEKRLLDAMLLAVPR